MSDDKLLQLNKLTSILFTHLKARNPNKETKKQINKAHKLFAGKLNLHKISNN